MAEQAPERIGCGDHSCVIVPPKGMGTNGGCRCKPWKLQAEVVRLRRDHDALRAQYTALLNGYPEGETPTDLRVLREANAGLADEVEEWRQQHAEALAALEVAVSIIDEAKQLTAFAGKPSFRDEIRAEFPRAVLAPSSTARRSAPARKE